MLLLLLLVSSSGQIRSLRIPEHSATVQRALPNGQLLWLYRRLAAWVVIALAITSLGTIPDVLSVALALHWLGRGSRLASCVVHETRIVGLDL